MWRAISRAPSWMERGILRAGSFGQHCGFSEQHSQSSLLARLAHHAVLIDERRRHSIDFSPLPEFLPGGAEIAIALLIVGEVVTREGAIGALRFVEHRDVRLDPALMHQPSEVLGRTVACVTRQSLGPETEVLLGAVDHPALRRPSRLKPFWENARKEAFAWLNENGYPLPGDGG